MAAAATRISSSSLTTPTATTGSLGYAASATDPHPTAGTSSKGVAVGLPYHGGADSRRGTGASYKTVRSSVHATTSRGERRPSHLSFISSSSFALPSLSPSLTVDASRLSAAKA